MNRNIQVSIDTFGTGTVSDEQILSLIQENFDLRPSSIMTYRRLSRRKLL